ncbi:MAG: sugar ABC transporter substrate-binding protein [Lachnospiraceae bacterium]|nr:sugar ABC transporter substrate-binding protein [Lachnospiraceae bacterium]
MKKRILSVILATMLTTSMVLSGCGGGQQSSSEGGGTTAADTSDSGNGSSGSADVSGSTDGAASGDAGAPAASHDTELTLEVYDVAANYQGLQTGWYGKILKDKFNIVLNIIAPQVSGDGEALYQTRTAAGNLGDIVLLDNADMLECVDVGLVADISGDIRNYPNLMRYWEQIEKFNAAIGDGSGIYAIPTEMNTNGPTAYVQETVSSMPRIPWDFYSELGTPDLNTLDDLLNVLADMQAAHPTNEAGDSAYAMTLWSDWDNNSIENVNQLTKWYGQEAIDSILIGDDNTIKPLTDKDGAYYKMLHFFFQANQMGLVDPDSATQDWNAACDKMKQKRTYLVWNNWMQGFTNSPEIGAKGANYMGIPIADMRVFQQSDYYYGSGRVFGIGSQVSEENKVRILEFLDWLASPEGLDVQHASLEGLIYTVNDDGTYALTEDGYNRFNTEIMISEDLGGGNWTDGNNQVNQWIGASVDTNPVTGEAYDPVLWAASIEKNNTKTTIEWREKFGAENEVEYLKSNGMMNPVPSINMSLAIDTTDIGLIRSQCKTIICDSSWKAIYAADEAAFEAAWDEMCKQLDGFGWQDLVAFDTEKYQPVVDARKAAQ